MTFDDYLKEKRIDGKAFQAGEPERWEEWSVIFIQMSPASFTSQKLYLINPTRRKYPLQETASIAKPVAAPASRPVFKPKMK